MIVVMTLLGLLSRSILIVVIEVALTCPYRLKHLSESKSRFDVSEQAFRIRVRLKWSIRLFHLCERGSVAGYLRLRPRLRDRMGSQIDWGIQIVLRGTQTNCGIRVFLLAVILSFSVHWKPTINELCETALLQMKRITVFREHFKIVVSVRWGISDFNIGGLDKHRLATNRISDDDFLLRDVEVIRRCLGGILEFKILKLILKRLRTLHISLFIDIILRESLHETLSISIFKKLKAHFLDSLLMQEILQELLSQFLVSQLCLL